MAIFTAVRNKKQTAGTMMGVLKYVTQACKTMLDDQWMVTDTTAWQGIVPGNDDNQQQFRKRMADNSITSSNPPRRRTG